MWEAKLRLISTTLSLWGSCQRRWLQVQPVCASSELKAQLPVDYRRFGELDSVWRKLMDSTERQPKLTTAMSDEDLMPRLRECLKSLENISRSLATFLDTKRVSFPRLYLVPDTELLTMLADASHPDKHMRLPLHLRAVFPAVAGMRVVYRDHDLLRIVATSTHDGGHFSQVYQQEYHGLGADTLADPTAVSPAGAEGAAADGAGGAAAAAAAPQAAASRRGEGARAKKREQHFTTLQVSSKVRRTFDGFDAFVPSLYLPCTFPVPSLVQGEAHIRRIRPLLIIITELLIIIR